MPQQASPSSLSFIASQLLFILLLFASDSLSFSFGHYSYILTPALRTKATTAKYILLERTQHQHQHQQKHKCHQRLLFSNIAEDEQQQQEGENVDFVAVNNPRQDVNIEETTTKTTTTSAFSGIVSTEEEHEGRNDSDTDMPSLDDVLNRARKKKLVIPMAMIQSFFDAPLWIVRIPSDTKTTTTTATTKTALAIFTRMDGLLIFVSTVFLHANGFALGLLIGKLTIRPVTKLFNPPPSIQTLLLPSWTVVWAIGLDQVL